MESVYVPAALGILICLMGILNMKGNLSSLHWYHRSRVKEEDILPFGRTVGLGTVIIGCAVILNACFEFAYIKTGNSGLQFFGNVILACGLGAGLILSVYAMIRYNKGIF